MAADAGYDYLLIDALRARWSPRAFSDRELTTLDLRQLFEAARWSSSCFNEQPWRFVVARRGAPGHQAAISTLVTRNQGWARRAGALVIACTLDTFAANGKSNKWARHDLGLAIAQLSTQATAMGVSLHMMAGFDADAAREKLEIPDGVTPVVAIAIGHRGELDVLDESFHGKELATRSRRPQSEFVFADRFGDPLTTVEPYDRVLDFWFGELDELGMASDEHQARWWKKDVAFDAEVRETFADLHVALAAGEHLDWRRSARGTIASIVALDQFPRNMHRDRPEMYATDELATTLAFEAIERGFDLALPTHMRAFVYMPLMHSERLEHQEACVDLFGRAADSTSGAPATVFAGMRQFAIKHRDIVARWGRFPHRNKILDRESTAEEVEFLTQPGSSF